MKVNNVTRTVYCATALSASAFAPNCAAARGCEDNPIAAQKWIISDAWCAESERKEARGGGANKKQASQPHLSRATKPEICTFILSCGERAWNVSISMKSSR